METARERSLNRISSYPRKRCLWVSGLVLANCLLIASTSVLTAQSVATAKRRADLQVGIGFDIASSDYIANKIKGFSFYTTLDLTNHFGGEFVIHQVNSNTGDQLYERTYEIGPRYHRTYGRFSPYIKAMYGRGVFNFPNSVANLAYNMFAIGAGTDVRVTRYLNVRGDYEYQDWRSFPPNGLTPQVVTIGVAYHFPGGLKRGLHW